MSLIYAVRKKLPEGNRFKMLLASACLVVAGVIAFQQYHLGSYNNFQIFSASIQHLLHGANLYLFYPAEYDDLFLYNPTFPVLFAPLTFLPKWAGILAWTTISLFAYLFAIHKLPLRDKEKLLLLVLSLPDCINSLQHMQVNHVNLAFMLFTFICLRNNKPFLAALFTVVLFYIKIYPAAIGLCFLFFPNKLKYLAGCLVWFVILFALPLIFIPLPALLQQYQNWFISLNADKTIEECATSLSLISINYQWFKHPVTPSYIQAAGLVIMLLPLVVKRSLFNVFNWQLTYLAGLLLFVIVFNHAAESATYLLAVTGVGIWFINSRKSLADKLLLAFVIVLTVLSITDIFPATLKKEFVQPYSLRAVPCLLVWIKVIIDLLTLKRKNAQPTLI